MGIGIATPGVEIASRKFTGNESSASYGDSDSSDMGDDDYLALALAKQAVTSPLGSDNNEDFTQAQAN